jgi:8-oxo-dGTP pyrophosphatase MutT (NUDIX family)
VGGPHEHPERAATAAGAGSSPQAGDTFPADTTTGDTFPADAGVGVGPGAEDALPTVLSSRVLYTGKVVTLRVDEIVLPGGGTALREVVRHPGAVVVVALDGDEHLYLVRQYRHAIGRYLLELPAGGLEPDEEPLAAAQRELREEVGLAAKEWVHLGSFYSTPGFVNELLHAYLARGLSAVPRDPDDDEDIAVIRLPLAGLLEHLEEVPDAKTLATLLLLHRFMQREQTTTT